MDQTLEHKRHTLAHLLAAAVLKHYPDAKLTLGPAIDSGFYYDIDFEANNPGEDDLKKIEKTMRELLPSWREFSHEEVSAEEAKKRFTGNPFKEELVDEIAARGEKITLYTCGGFTDLCRGGHSEHPSKDIAPDSFILDRIAGAYWRGDEKNPMLTRIYGLAFDTKEELDAHMRQREEAQARDHKKLGKELDLYVIDEKVGKGLPLWTPKGTAIKFELENFAREIERKYGYQHVETPYLGSAELYKTSGHLDHYTHSMYAPIDMDGEKYYLRPMACPHHIRLLMRKPLSYRDLPIRYAEIADYNRFEKSGELMGMIRTRYFELTDGHLFMRPDQLKDEFILVCKMIAEGMKVLGLSDIVTYRFSKRNPHNKEKYYPDDELWEKAEGVMKEALDEIGFKYIEAEDEAAFYGPKLDVQGRNVNGKEDTLFTAQIDFLLPEKFGLTYTDKDGSEKQAVMIHRSTIGSLVRIFAFLTEHYGGAFPLWIAPVQVYILPVHEKQITYASEILNTLRANNLRAEIITEDSLGKRIHTVRKEKTPYFLIVGDREAQEYTVTLESRDGHSEKLSLEALIERLVHEHTTRK